MHYKAGYLTMFTQITLLLEQLQAVEPAYQRVDIIYRLRQIQANGEEACIAGNDSESDI